MPYFVDTTPARLDLKVSQLTPLVLTLLCTDAEGTPIDFSGCQAVLHVSQGSSPAWERTTGDGSIVLTSGQIGIQVPLADMEALPVGRYPYHLIVTTAGGTELLPFVLSGLFVVVSGEVT